MMSTTLILLIVIFAGTMLWLDGARARELAVAISKAACDKQGFQLLDETVYLQRLGIRWTVQGLRFRRMFRFEYSIEGTLRETGYVLLIGTALEAIHIGNSQSEAQSTDNIVPFKKR